MQFWWDIYRALAPYAKSVEYAVIFATLALGLYAASRLRRSTRQMQHTLDSAVERLKAQSQEMADELERAGLAAIERIRAKLAEENSETPTAIDTADAPARAEATTISDAESRARREAHDAWWRPVEAMISRDPDQPPPRLYWKNNVRAPMPWRGTWLTGWHNDRADGVCGVALSGTRKSIDAFWRRIRAQASSLEAELPDGATVEPGRFGIAIVRPNSQFHDDDERRAWIVSNMNRFADVLRPRMKALVEKQH